MKTQNAIETFKVLDQSSDGFNWFIEIEKKSVLTVLEHTAALSLFKNHTFEHLEARLLEVLNRSYFQFTGKSNQGQKRLPISVLKNASRDDVLFHQSLFHEGQLTLGASLRMIYDDYILNLKDAFFGLIAMTVLALFDPVRSVCLGLAFGYLFSSAMEYLVHLFIAHSTPNIKSHFKKLGPVGEDMLRFSLEHQIHHGIVSRNYSENLDQLNENKTKIDSFLRQRGGEKLLKLVQNSQYGLGSSNTTRTHLFFLPLTLIVISLFTLIFSFGPLIILGFLAASQIWITTSAIYHPYLHQSVEKIETHASPLMHFILRSRLSRFIARSHRMHHAKSGQVNQNLIIGADFILGWVPITLPELIDLKKRNVYY